MPEFKTKWKEALTACIEDLAARTRRDDETLTLLLDEFPVMLWDWIENGKAQDAIELLDLFRKLRISQKEQGRIRFVVCGSVGMQVVLDRLRREHHYTGEPLNDMTQFRLECMSGADAHFLCQCLGLSGFRYVGDSYTLHERICQFTEKLPFYINKVFQIIQIQYDGVISEQTIDSAEESLLNDSDQASTFDQLYQRIHIYYEKPKRDMMIAILDRLAKQTGYQSEQALLEHCQPASSTDFRGALETLRNEQYITRKIFQDERCYQFKYNLIKRWWKLNKA